MEASPKSRKRHSLVLINQQSSQPTLISRWPKEGLPFIAENSDNSEKNKL